MEITVKRRTWLLGILMSVSLKFNGETVASLSGFQEKTISIHEPEGQLEYVQPMDRSHQVRVKDGDIITLEETPLNKTLNILFFATLLYNIFANSYVLYTGTFFDHRLSGMLAIASFIVFIAVGVISLFFNSYRLVVENKSEPAQAE